MNSTPRTGRRLWLDQDAIVDAALELVRTEGLAAVTMRRVAEAVGYGPMALYRHVADRQDLLVRMLDRIAYDIELPELPADPCSRIRTIMVAHHDALLADSWAVQLLAAEGLAGPSILPLLELVFQALHDGGLDDPTAVRAYGLIWSYTAGEVLVTHHDRPDSFAMKMVSSADPERFPRVATVARAKGSVAAPDRYPIGLDWLLNGIFRAGPDRTIHDSGI